MEGFINPEEVLDQLDLRSDMVAAEFGCGSGGFTIPLAKKLEEGMVYAIDVQSSPLSVLRSRAALENVSNIRTIRSDLEEPRGSTLSDVSLDLVLIPNVLFQIEKKSAIINEAERILKTDGELVIIDWLPKSPQGPEKGRVRPEEVKEIAKRFDFKLKKEFEAGKYHYCLVFEKT